MSYKNQKKISLLKILRNKINSRSKVKMHSRKRNIKYQNISIKALLKDLKMNYFKDRKRHLVCNSVYSLNNNCTLILIKAFDIVNLHLTNLYKLSIEPRLLSLHVCTFVLFSNQSLLIFLQSLIFHLLLSNQLYRQLCGLINNDAICLFLSLASSLPFHYFIQHYRTRINIAGF